MPNSATNLAEAEFGRIWEKWSNFEFAEAEAEIRCNPNHAISLTDHNMVFCIFGNAIKIKYGQK